MWLYRRSAGGIHVIIVNDIKKAVEEKGNKNAIWSLLLASGYLKCDKIIQETPEDTAVYRLVITNFEVKKMFENMISNWFEQDETFNEFVKAMFKGDIRGMNQYMNKVALNTFSYFDAGKKPSEEEPEKFYHGFAFKGKECLIQGGRSQVK